MQVGCERDAAREWVQLRPGAMPWPAGVSAVHRAAFERAFALADAAARVVARVLLEPHGLTNPRNPAPFRQY